VQETEGRVEIRDLTKERIAVNQSRFREANERIELAADSMGIMGPIPFICECADPQCVEIVRLKLEDYEEIRHDARLFFCTSGHEVIAVEAGAGVVTGRRDDYVLVEKIGVAGEVAAQDYRDLNDA
jgi:hypothetical protein